MNIVRMIGGGESWWYLVDAAGRVRGAAHHDDVGGMAKLRAALGDP